MATPAERRTLPADESQAPATPARPVSASPSVVPAVVLLVALGLAFLIVSAPDIGSSFGQSDEGLNAAVWGYGSRSFRELGPLESALGGRRLDGRAYATHPPGLLAETTLAETIAGEHPGSTRAAAWVGSLAAIVLLFFLLRELGLSPTLAAAATVAALGTPMFFTYGWMLDTPVTSFPFGVAVALVWQRARARGQPRWWLAALVALLAGLSGWQATVFVVVLALWSVVERPTGGRRRQDGAPYLVGAFVGFVLSIGWGLWVYGDITHLKDKLFLRSTGESSSVGSLLSYQSQWTGMLLGIGLLGLVACVVACRDTRFRPLAASSLLSVGGYMILFRGAAASHPFWNYWLLLPTAIGYAYAFTWVRTRNGARAEPAIVGFAIVVAVLGIALPGSAKENIRFGTDAVTALQRAPLPAGQTELPYVGDIAGPEDWMLYDFGVMGRAITDPAELRAWATAHPDQIVLVVGPCHEGDRACEQLLLAPGAAVGDYHAVRGRDVVTAVGP